MNELKQNIIIASVLSERSESDFKIHAEDGKDLLVEHPAMGMQEFVWEFFTDSLDSCRLFEEALSDEEMQDYALWLSFSTKGSAPIYTYVAIVKATPTQRCEAFLRTLNLWETTNAQ